jgi:hypothetical protein
MMAEQVIKRINVSLALIKKYFTVTLPLISMQKLIASLFLFIFSFQILPVKEIGSILYKQLMTEEIHEAKTCSDDHAPSKVKPAIEPFLLSNSGHLNHNRYFGSTVMIAIHKAESLPIPHIPDIFTPPPDFC